MSLNIPINYGSLRIISLVSGMGLSLSVTTVIIVIMTFMDLESDMGTRHYVTSSWRICRVSLVCNLDWLPDSVTVSAFPVIIACAHSSHIASLSGAPVLISAEYFASQAGHRKYVVRPGQAGIRDKLKSIFQMFCSICESCSQPQCRANKQFQK